MAVLLRLVRGWIEYMDLRWRRTSADRRVRSAPVRRSDLDSHERIDRSDA
jgi:hypothetical protein